MEEIKELIGKYLHILYKEVKITTDDTFSSLNIEFHGLLGEIRKNQNGDLIIVSGPLAGLPIIKGDYQIEIPFQQGVKPIKFDKI